jgi:hypothetical protein
MTPAELADKAEKVLLARWSDLPGKPVSGSSLPEQLQKDIHASINATTKTYRYVLPTQVLAKVVDSSLDCRCIQVSRGGPGAFDARSLCHEVVVPFDRANDNVLGGSSEPYANNPVRVAEVSGSHRAAQRDKAGWDRLCNVLDTIDQRQDPDFTLAVLDAVLDDIRDRLEGTAVSYAVPQRVSHTRLLWSLEAYLAPRSGGVRLQAVAAGLFETIGARFSVFSDVRSAKPTAADASTGQLADIECYDAAGRLALAVEVKDRELTVTQISDKALAAREARVTELLFIGARGVRRNQSAEVLGALEHHFASGHNVYVFRFEDFAAGVLALLGEDGRREFLDRVGKVLERYQASLSDRRTWAATLTEL